MLQKKDISWLHKNDIFGDAWCDRKSNTNSNMQTINIGYIDIKFISVSIVHVKRIADKI